MDQPFISIITPSYNRAAMIGEAVESVLEQNYPAFEHIIIDGASTDNTLNVLKKYSHLRIISEPDNGMYDAINKGLKIARGDLVAWLNTDDVYSKKAFSIIIKTYKEFPEALAFSGGAEIYRITSKGKQIIRVEQGIGERNFWQRIVSAPVSNGWFFTRDVFRMVGNFNPDYRIAADMEFIIRVGLAGIRPVFIPDILYSYCMHEDSLTLQTEDSRHPVYGPRRMAGDYENLKMFQGFLSQPDLPKKVRRTMVSANSEYAYRLTATALYHRKKNAVLDGLHAGMKYDPLFPFAFVRFALRRIIQGKRV